MAKLLENIAKHVRDTFSFDSGMEEFKKWTVKYINTLSNSSFAVIEPAYLSGETLNKRSRHLPYKDDKGKIDLPHLRNALARANQIKPVTDSITTVELRKRAVAKLNVAKKAAGMASDKVSVDNNTADTEAPEFVETKSEK